MDLATEALVELVEEQREAADLTAITARLADLERELADLKSRPAPAAAPIKITGGKLGKRTLEITVTGRDDQERIKTAEVTIPADKGTVH